MRDTISEQMDRWLFANRIEERLLVSNIQNASIHPQLKVIDEAQKRLKIEGGSTIDDYKKAIFKIIHEKRLGNRVVYLGLAKATTEVYHAMKFELTMKAG
ncbi:hypothetical protein ABD87_22870 [Lysinibacillus sphaericus]|uniref:hypothetical protein n=1 Tax=Lysinibacillus sphaericus TaxID=1421 RepID=UPI0018CE223C|nr:hypothetical protein [Lysinibacillus sphaericus]MBG9732271.1 hypothetical protein [Lysinibacillus sphaericus]